MLNHKVCDLYQPMQSYSFAQRIGSTSRSGKPDCSVYSLEVQEGNVNHAPQQSENKFRLQVSCILGNWQHESTRV